MADQMNKPILASSAALLVAFYIPNLRAFAEEGGKLSAWSVKPAAIARLAEEFDGGWYSIRPPKGYVQAELGDVTAYDRAGIKVAAWTRETGGSVNPTITILSFPKPAGPGESDRAIFEGFIQSLTTKWPDAKSSEISEGLWNGDPALRFQFSATGENGEAIQGVAVCCVGDSGTFVVSALCVGDAGPGIEELAILKNSAVSCQQKSSPAP